MPISNDHLADLEHATVIDEHGEEVGGVGHVYVDDTTGAPAWASVKTGLLGMKESFVPLQDADLVGGELRVPYSKDTIKDAPGSSSSSHLDGDQQARLQRHYSLASGAGVAEAAGAPESVGASGAPESTGAATTGGATADVTQDGPSDLVPGAGPEPGLGAAPGASARPSEGQLSSYSDDRPASSPAAYQGGPDLDHGGSRLRRHEWPDRRAELDRPLDPEHDAPGVPAPDPDRPVDEDDPDTQVMVPDAERPVVGLADDPAVEDEAVDEGRRDR